MPSFNLFLAWKKDRVIKTSKLNVFGFAYTVHIELSSLQTLFLKDRVFTLPVCFNKYSFRSNILTVKRRYKIANEIKLRKWHILWISSIYFFITKYTSSVAGNTLVTKYQNRLYAKTLSSNVPECARQSPACAASVCHETTTRLERESGSQQDTK